VTDFVVHALSVVIKGDGNLNFSEMDDRGSPVKDAEPAEQL
jgi:hypothetical protein